MVEPNVVFTLPDAQQLYDGQSPDFPYPVRQVELARFTSRSNALAGTAPTVVYQWTLNNPATSERTEWDGPFSFGYFDPFWTPTLWYAYRLIGSGSEVSAWSEPWAGTAYDLPTAGEILTSLTAYVGSLLRVGNGTYTATAVTSPIFGDPTLSQDFFVSWYLWPLGADLPGQKIAAVGGNTATLYPGWSSAPAPGPFAVTPLLSFEQAMTALQQTLMDAQVEREFTLPATDDVIDAPQQVVSPSDIQRVFAVWNGKRYPVRWSIESWRPLRLRIERHPMAEYVLLVALASIADSYGQITSVLDEVPGPRRLIEAMLATTIGRMLLVQDPEDPFAAAFYQRAVQRSNELIARYAPEPQRPIVPNSRGNPLPGPVPRW
ncbi:MAG: hypothetical protein KatS3mg051_1814 [Anaerolineae bacterium]|nr:MAG: hypothetical protein KatS3mg051_1814 [Anaerolineae bacterium]